jgi:CheY-like chemotaxis protein
MKDEAYLSTGEAAELLGLSRSTVSRRFDAGVLTGRVNPLTGERMISRHSVLELIRRHDLPVNPAAIASRRVLVAAPDTARRGMLTGFFAHDTRVHVTATAAGTDTLVACGRETPDLAILDETFPDVAALDVVRSLKAAPGAGRVTVLCAVRPENAEAVQAAGADGILDAARLDSEAHRALAYRVLGLPRTPPAGHPVVEYQRRWSRIPTRMAARLFVYPVARPDAFMPGRAVVEDISRQGARLTGLDMDGGMLPAEPFRLRLEIDEPPLTHWSAVCRVMRLQSDPPLELGLQFADISDADLAKIVALQDEA